MFDDTEQAVEQLEQVEQPTQEQQEEAVQKQAESKAERNFKALRDEAEKIRKERDEAVRLLQELKSSQQKDEDDSFLGEDALVEGRHLKQTHKKLRQLEDDLRNFQQKNSELLVETKIKAEYPDFDSVVTKENIDALRANYPELTNMLNPQSDLYATAKSAYTLIKKFGIVPEDTYSQDKELVKKNAGKPRSIASLSPQQGESPMSHANAFANGLTDDLKKQLLKEMEDARRSL